MPRTTFTTITPLPQGISRETVRDTLWDHKLMIDLNPLVVDRYPIRPPPHATPEEAQCVWYEIKDKVGFLPGVKSEVAYSACFHDLPDGLQTHIYAPMSLDIRGKWSVGGSLPGELRGPTELGLGIPKEGLYLREDVDMRCNVLFTKFVKANLKKSHATLVSRMIERSHVQERDAHNARLLRGASEADVPSVRTNTSSASPPTEVDSRGMSLAHEKCGAVPVVELQDRGSEPVELHGSERYVK